MFDDTFDDELISDELMSPIDPILLNRQIDINRPIKYKFHDDKIYNCMYTPYGGFTDMRCTEYPTWYYQNYCTLT